MYRSRRLNAANIACSTQKVYARRLMLLSARTTRRRQAGVTMRSGASCMGGVAIRSISAQELPGCQHSSATIGRVWSDGLQQQRDELADRAVAAEQVFDLIAASA
jgi:hypothetical protein